VNLCDWAIYHFLFRRWSLELINQFVDLISFVAIHNEVDLCVRYLCQLVHLFEETFCSLSDFLLINVSLSSNFCHEDIERCFDRSFLKSQWKYILLENKSILKSSEWMSSFFWMSLIVEQCHNFYRKAQSSESRNKNKCHVIHFRMLKESCVWERTLLSRFS